jgi:BirA family biotin operon repressor/biotin-[acetyl-CoA-carboxylase] ligase
MGLNVLAAGRAPELDATAVACDELPVPGAPAADGVPPSREALLTAWLTALDRWYAAAVDPARGDELWSAWRSRSATLGRRVRVDVGVDDVVGEAVDVTDRGLLVVRTVEGELRTLAVGDVTHLRLA